MNPFQRYVQMSSNAFTEYRLLKFCFIALVIYCGVLTSLFNRSEDAVRTHIIPVGGTGEFIISGSSASNDYLRSMAEYLVIMLANNTAANARRQFTEILHLFVPEKFNEYRERFNNLATQIERYPTITYSISFSGRNHVELVDDHLLRVHTIKRRIVGNDVPKIENMVYEIDYKIEQGRFWIKDVKEIKDVN